jgi:hypothetical protein
VQFILDSNTSDTNVVDSMECNGNNYQNLNHGHINSHNEPTLMDIQ